MKLLCSPKFGKLARKIHSAFEHDPKVKKELEENFKNILRLIGEDPEREGLKKTPHRAAEALLYFTQGYHTKPKEVLNNAIFQEGNIHSVYH
jgi:GTP cyclohydrolase I